MTTVLDTFILFSITPIGFIVIMLLLVFFEYLIILSVIKDVKMVVSYIKSYKSKVGRVLQRKHIGIKKIPSPIGVAINHIKINEWFG